jgi:hypothetical protein
VPLAQELIAVRGTKIKYAAGPLLDSTFPFPLAAPFPQSSPASPADAGKEIKKLAKYDGLIIDEGGYVQQSREQMEVVFTRLAERYERGSVRLTSNLPFSKWEGIFKDAMTTAAAIDRLVHHCIILELNIPSYRMEQARRNRDAGLESTEAK